MGIFGRKSSKGRQHTDPVCGMVIVEEEAVGPDTVQGEAVWFCSAQCQETYRGRKGAGGSRRDADRARREAKQEVAR